MAKRTTTKAETSGVRPKRVRSKPATEKPIWEVFEDIAKSVPVSAWKSLPKDLSRRVDYYLYGKGQPRLLGRKARG